MDQKQLQNLAKLVRYYSLFSSTSAGSGHPTTSLSAADLMTVLFFKHLRFDLKNPDNVVNDRVIFSKGHASPLFYALYAGAGVLTKPELATMRQFDSILEGHPTPRFKYTEAATGSLGQGLSIGFGMALALRSIVNENFDSSSVSLAKKDIINKQSMGRSQSEASQNFVDSPPAVYVLLGDGEMAEGSVWEAIQLSAHYKLSNLIGILDVNRLGQSDATMYGHSVDAYAKRIGSFGWNVITIDGHNLKEISTAFEKTANSQLQPANVPTMIIAKTVKGKGVSFLQDKEGWHGKALKQEEFDRAVAELGEIDFNFKGVIKTPEYRISNNEYGMETKEKDQKIQHSTFNIQHSSYKLDDKVATRQAYGKALALLGQSYPQIVALDADVKNSTYSEIFKAAFPERFYDMYIAEQNMVGAAIGFARLGFVPFVSTFAAFFTRAFDQIRMASLSAANIKLVGSHAGVSIGEDGASQMGLEDFAMFRAVHGSVVLHPADSVSTEKLTHEMVKHKGLVYMRTSRPATQVIYETNEEFPIGGSKIFKSVIPTKPEGRTEGSSASRKVEDSSTSLGMTGGKITIFSCGVTLHEALKAQEQLAKENISIDVIDCYSLKPIDATAVKKAAQESKALIVVEDHWSEGGLADAVRSVFDGQTHPPIYHLSVGKTPRSGKPEELLAYEGIDSKSIIEKVKEII